MLKVQKFPARRTLALLLISTSIICGGCKSKKNDIGAIGDANVLISQSDFGDIGNVLKVTPRKVSPDAAEPILKSAGLWQESELISWDSRTLKNDTYVFKNVLITEEDGSELKLGRLNLAGIHMQDDAPSADLMTASDIHIKHEDGIVLTIENIGLTDVGIGHNFDAIGSENRFDPSQAFVASGVKANLGDEGFFEVGRIGWGQDLTDEHLRVAIKDLNMNITDKEKIAFKLDAADIRSLGPLTETQKQSLKSAVNTKRFTGLLAQNQQLGDGLIKGFSLESDSFSVELPKFLQTAKVKGDITNINYDMPSLKIAMREAKNMAPDALRMVKTFQSLGFDKMDFSSKGQTVLDKEADLMEIKAASFDLKDGFDLNYSGVMSGLNALRALGADGSASAGALRGQQDNVKLHNFALSLEDKSIVERGFKLAGEMMGKDPDDLRRQANGVLALGSLAALTQGDGAIYSEFSKALSEYIDEGGTLNIALKPETPLSMNELQNLGKGGKPNLKKLGFSSSRTK